MATRSRIGIQLADDSILSVYHHWDGYPEWLGVTLKEKFNTFEKIAELIDGGDLSSCDSNNDWDLKELGETHPLYYNDRGEDTQPKLDLNDEDYFESVDNCGGEFAYIFENNEWNCFEIPYPFKYGNVKQVEIKEKQPVG